MSGGIGARLRGARERSRLTILQAAEKLHVDPDILEALEAEDFAALGAPVYVRGHLRHYAQLVGEPVDALLELYSQGARVPPPDLTRIPKATPRNAGRMAAPAALVAIGLAVAVAIWWVLSLAHPQSVSNASYPVPARLEATTPPPPARAGHLVLVGATASPTRVADNAPAVAAQPAKAAAEAGVSVTSAAPRQGELQATFTYSGSSWTEVYDASGRRLLYGMSKGPSTRKLDGVPPLTVMLGDASGVTIEVGGRQASIARFMRPDHTARFLIAADGRVLPAPAKKGG